MCVCEDKVVIFMIVFCIFDAFFFILMYFIGNFKNTAFYVMLFFSSAVFTLLLAQKCNRSFCEKQNIILSQTLSASYFSFMLSNISFPNFVWHVFSRVGKFSHNFNFARNKSNCLTQSNFFVYRSKKSKHFENSLRFLSSVCTARENYNKSIIKSNKSVKTKTFATMCSTCSGKSNDELISNLYKHGIIRSNKVYDAMLRVNRGDFTAVNPYMDSPQSIGNGATISAPHMHAYALEYLKDRLFSGSKVLDVGSGSGYLTVCFAHMVDVLNDGKECSDGGEVIGIDCKEELVQLSKRNVEKNNKRLLQSKNFKLLKGDGWTGVKGNKFDVIHVGAAVSHIPQALLEQLNNNGKMIIPVGEEGCLQKLMLVEKDEQGRIKQHNLFGVSYVPLVKLNYNN